MIGSSGLDVNNNEVDAIGLHFTRAEMDLTAELKRLTMGIRPPTPGAPLKRSEKIINFPSKINFDEMGLGADSTTEINGKLESLRVRTPYNQQSLSPIPMKPESSMPTTAFLVASHFHSRSKGHRKQTALTSSTVKTFRSSSGKVYPQYTDNTSIPSEGNGGKEHPFWDIGIVPSISDKSKGDGGGQSFRISMPPRAISDLESFGTPRTTGDIPSGTIKTAGKSKGKAAANPAGTSVGENPTSITTKGNETAAGELTSVTGTKGQSVDGEDGKSVDNAGGSSNDSRSKSTIESDSGSGSKTNSTKSSNSTKSGTGSSALSAKSQKPPQPSVVEDDVVEVCQDPEGKRGAIMFKVPGRLTHKTTIKVSHFPQNGNSSITSPPVAPPGNTECIVEDITPQQMYPPCAPCPDPQGATAMQQMMAYQQYCNRSMYCNPYMYYPYGGGC